MFILNINMDCHDVDVNVTPDKLQMFIKNEAALLATIKASMLKMYNRSFKNMNVENNSLNNSKASSQLINSFFSPTAVSSKKKFSQVSGAEYDEVQEVDKSNRLVLKENAGQSSESLALSNARKRSKLDDEDGGEDAAGSAAGGGGGESDSKETAGSARDPADGG